jgi:hypothetical protein
MQRDLIWSAITLAAVPGVAQSAGLGEALLLAKNVE